MSLGTVGQLMEDRSFSQGTRHVPESLFRPGQEGVGPPDLFGIQVFSVGLQERAAVEALRPFPFRCLFLTEQLPALFLIGELEVASNPGVAFP